eukprot:TRINITY_DN211_c0_g1_i1.p2 TRINITY_DN211_c0_g1~~TRINITY_DN211_c0_g1_i1.p2  ORF type:complete len:103 (-),score=32.17 TRINITY_DN211_c0_g1_i1:52-360(-)
MMSIRRTIASLARTPLIRFGVREAGNHRPEYTGPTHRPEPSAFPFGGAAAAVASAGTVDVSAYLPVKFRAGALRMDEIPDRLRPRELSQEEMDAVESGVWVL